MEHVELYTTVLGPTTTRASRTHLLKGHGVSHTPWRPLSASWTHSTAPIAAVLVEDYDGFDPQRQRTASSMRSPDLQTMLPGRTGRRKLPLRPDCLSGRSKYNLELNLKGLGTWSQLCRRGSREAAALWLDQASVNNVSTTYIHCFVYSLTLEGESSSLLKKSQMSLIKYPTQGASACHDLAPIHGCTHTLEWRPVAVAGRCILRIRKRLKYVGLNEIEVIVMKNARVLIVLRFIMPLYQIIIMTWFDIYILQKEKKQ
jgi:hypothetical protein